MGKTPEQIEDIFSTPDKTKAIKLAEKVEDRDAWAHLKTIGCDLYQGYFFAKPETLEGRNLNSTEISKFKVLQAIEKPNLSAQEMTDIIGADPSLTYRLLRLLNSASFGFRIKIKTIKHAILLLGVRRIRYWA